MKIVKLGVLTTRSFLLCIFLACGSDKPPGPEDVLASTEEEASVLEPLTDETGAPRLGSPNGRLDIHASLVESRAQPKHPADGGGRAWRVNSTDSPPVTARDRSTWEFVYEAGPEGIVEGGIIEFLISPVWGWSTPQTEVPEAPGYTEVSTQAEGIELITATLDETLLGILIAGRTLQEGEQIRIRYGVAPGWARADEFSERESPFFFGVDGDGDGVAQWLPEPVTTEISAGLIAQLVAFLPSTAEPGKEIVLRIRALDAMANMEPRIPHELSELHLILPQGISGPKTIRLDTEGGASATLRTQHEGVFRIGVRSDSLPLTTTNPMVVSSTAPRVLWGDLHGHSALSDGTGTPEDFYRYARDVAALDVAALTDHDHWGTPFLDETPRAWERIVRAARDFHDPPNFVTLRGYEWTHWVFGHRHVLYFEDDGGMFSHIDPSTDTPSELWDALRKQNVPVLTFAHHSAGEPVATDWSFPPPPDLEPVTEIVSVHGSSESPYTVYPVDGGLPGHYIVDALNMGYRLGLIGSGDSHDGHPGLVQLARGSSGGLAAILTQANSREGILEALRARRVYATNGPRIVLMVDLDDQPMGTTHPAAGEKVLSVSVVTEQPIEAVEVISGGDLILYELGHGRLEMTFASEIGGMEPGSWLYVRVLQADAGAAWSSPFFFD